MANLESWHLREGGRGFWDLPEIRIYQDWGNTCSEVMEIDIQISNAEKNNWCIAYFYIDSWKKRIFKEISKLVVNCTPKILDKRFQGQNQSPLENNKHWKTGVNQAGSKFSIMILWRLSVSFTFLLPEVINIQFLLIISVHYSAN